MNIKRSWIVGERPEFELVLWTPGLLVEAHRKRQLAAFGFDDLQMAKPVEGLAPSRRRKPRAWGSGQAVLGPGFKCDGEGVLQRILGELKVAEDADQRCQDGTGLRSEDPIESARSLAHLPSYISGTFISGRISIEPVRASGILAAQAIASFKSLTSTT